MKTASRSVSNRAARSAASALIAATLVALVAGAPAARADSLWPTDGGNERSMFADRKAGRTGDILTVVVQESAAATTTQSNESARSSDLTDAVTQFMFSPAASSFGTHNGELPGISLGGSATYSGGGSVNNSQSISSRAAVLVSDVLPNGVLVIQGVRMVRFSGETQYVVLHGLVRADDISRDNTVISSNIADARVEFYAEGALTDAQKRGWLAKVYEKLRPF